MKPADTQLTESAEAVAEDREAVVRNHYVILIHGIRTHAEYQTKLASELEQISNIKAVSLGYEFLDVIRFLTVGRNGAINKITAEIRDLKTMEPAPEKISVIAHSFGTYIVSKILERHTDIDFHRIIFCGSIVPTTFRWDHYKSRFEKPVLNDCGMFDIWPVFAKFATWGYGPSGRFGFGSGRVRDRFHRFKHSDFFTERNSHFFSDYWKPFLEHGDIVEGELKREGTPLWTSLLTLVKAPVLALALALLGWLGFNNWGRVGEAEIAHKALDSQHERQSVAEKAGPADEEEIKPSSATTTIIIKGNNQGQVAGDDINNITINNQSD